MQEVGPEDCILASASLPTQKVAKLLRRCGKVATVQSTFQSPLEEPTLYILTLWLSTSHWSSWLGLHSSCQKLQRLFLSILPMRNPPRSQCTLLNSFTN